VLRWLAVLPLIAGCVHPIESALESARGGDAGVVITWEERGGPLGRREVRIAPDGSVRERRWRPGFIAVDDPAAAEAHLQPGEVTDEGAVVRVGQLSGEAHAELIRTILAIDGWEHEDHDSLPAGPVDRSRATLILEAGEDRSEAWEHREDLESNERLVRVGRLIDGIALAAAPE